MKRIIITLIILLAFAVSVEAVQYEIIDLDTLGGNYSNAKSINDQGQVVGSAENDIGHSRAFYWERGSGMIDLVHISTAEGGASEINNSSQVVSSGFIWEPDNGVVESFNDNHFSGRSINNLGQVAGQSYTVDNSVHAFTWDDMNGWRKLE